MSRFNTGNPLGSNDPRDLDDNAKNMDLAVNSDDLSWVDRFGRDRKSFEGMEREFDEAQASRKTRFNDFMADSAYQFIGDYGAGIEITEYNQLVRDANGEFWRLSGQIELPYTTTGAGIPEDDALVPAGDAVLRQDLSDPDKGAAMVARGVVAVDSIADLLALPEGQKRIGLRYIVAGYYGEGTPGGGGFYWDAGRTDENDFGSIISGWVRIIRGEPSVYMFGARGDGVSDDTDPIMRAEAYRAELESTLHFPDGRFKYSYLNVSASGGWSLSKRALLIAAPLDAYQDRARIEITPPVDSEFVVVGGVFDGNKSQILPHRELLIQCAGGRVDFRRNVFLDTITASIRHYSDGSISNSVFKGAAPHEGTAGTTTLYLSLRGDGNIIDVERCRFYGDEGYAEGTHPGGVYSASVNSTINVRGCFFKNIGQNKAGNLVGCVDLYTNVDNSTVTGNRFVFSRYQAIKMQNSAGVICTGNTVLNSLHDIHDFNFQPSVRSNNIRKEGAVIAHNIGRQSGGISIIGSPNSEYQTGKIVVDANVLEDCLTSGVEVSYVDGPITLSNNMIDEHQSVAIRFSNFSGHAELTSNNTRTSDATTSLFARVGCENATFTVDGGSYESLAAPNFSIRDVAGVSLDGVRSSNNIDVQRVSGHLAVMRCSAPAMGGTVTESGYKTEFGNSWNPQVLFSPSAPTLGAYPRGTIVFRTTPSPGTSIGWVNAGTTAEPNWKSWGQISS